MDLYPILFLDSNELKYEICYLSFLIQMDSCLIILFLNSNELKYEMNYSSCTDIHIVLLFFLQMDSKNLRMSQAQECRNEFISIHLNSLSFAGVAILKLTQHASHRVSHPLPNLVSLGNTVVRDYPIKHVYFHFRYKTTGSRHAWNESLRRERAQNRPPNYFPRVVAPSNRARTVTGRIATAAPKCTVAVQNN